MSYQIADILHSILKQYHGAHDLAQVPLKVDLLRPMMEERGFADRIYWEKYHFPAKNIAAQVTFYRAEMGVYAGSGDYARIQYSSSLNFCWERFVVCKEMYHSVLDASVVRRVSNISDLLKLSEYLVDDTISSIENFEPHETEQLAEILALETLFPFELRSNHLAAYKANQISDLQLALRYRIPEEFARHAMYPAYYQAVERMRDGKLVQI